MAEKDEKLKKRLEAALELANHPEPSRQALGMLFPKAGNILGTYTPSQGQEGFENYRISDANFAHSYFALDEQKPTWGRSELENLFRSQPEQCFTVAIERIEAIKEPDQPRMRRLFLDALANAFTEQFPLSADWLMAILNFSPLFIRAKDQTSGFFFTDNDALLRRVLLRAFGTLEVGRQLDIIRAVVGVARDISLLCDFFRGSFGDRVPGGIQKTLDEALVPSINEVRDHLLSRVRDLARSGEIWTQADPATLLWFWYGSRIEENELRSFYYEAIETPAGLSNFLRVAISQVISSAGNYERVRVESWNAIIDFDDLAVRAQLIADLGNDEDVATASRFLNALDRGKKEPW